MYTHTLCWLRGARVTHRPLGQCLMHYIAERWTCPLRSSPLIACFVWRFMSWSWRRVSPVSCCRAGCCGCCFCQLAYARTAQWDRSVNTTPNFSCEVRVGLHGCTACLYLSTNVRREFSKPMGSKKKVESRKKWGRSPQAVWAINIWLSFLWFAN